MFEHMSEVPRSPSSASEGQRTSPGEGSSQQPPPLTKRAPSGPVGRGRAAPRWGPLLRDSDQAPLPCSQWGSSHVTTQGVSRNWMSQKQPPCVSSVGRRV